MATQTLRGAKDNVPVAKPAVPETGVATGEVVEETEAPFFSVETLKGFGSSLALHAVLLLVLAFWYFAPPSRPQRVFDTRLAGSEMGVEDGLTLTGGLNAEIEMRQGPTAAPEPMQSALSSLDMKRLETASSLETGADQATGGGGMKSNNPGAGAGDGFGLARFGSGGEDIRGVKVKVGDPQFTLLWDTDTDLDLHVVEPGGKEIYWESPSGKEGLGGELDVDNTKGFGPENIYWLKEDEGNKVPGPGPPGEYKWFVHYYGGGGFAGFGGRGLPKLTHWKVRIKHDGKVTVITGKLKAIGEKSRTYTLRVDPKEGTGGDTARLP